jgi:hypothetical protein
VSATGASELPRGRQWHETLSLRHSACAHICRYCLISETRKGSRLPFARFEALVHRFLDWKTANQRNDIEIRTFVGPSFDCDIETLQGVARIRAKRGDKLQILNLGGLRIRDRAALNGRRVLLGQMEF